MRIKALFAAGAAALSLSAAANAAQITYTFTGDFAYTVNGAAFAGSGTFTAVGDTDSKFFAGGPNYRVVLDSVTFSANDNTFALITPLQFFGSAGQNVGLFFGSNGNGGGSIAGTSAATVGYDGISDLALDAFATTFFNAAPGVPNFNTTSGTVVLTGFTNGGFGASVAAVVPEPGTWALLILGFGTIGAGMRRRSRTSFSYA